MQVFPVLDMLNLHLRINGISQHHKINGWWWWRETWFSLYCFCFFFVFLFITEVILNMMWLISVCLVTLQLINCFHLQSYLGFIHVCFSVFRPDCNFKRAGTGPAVKAARRRSNHSVIQPIRVKSLHLLRSKKNLLNQNPPSSSVLPSSLRSSTLPPSSSIPSSSPPSPSAAQSRKQQTQHDTPRTALIK